MKLNHSDENHYPFQNRNTQLASCSEWSKFATVYLGMGNQEIQLCLMILLTPLQSLSLFPNSGESKKQKEQIVSRNTTAEPVSLLVTLTNFLPHKFWDVDNKTAVSHTTLVCHWQKCIAMVVTVLQNSVLQQRTCSIKQCDCALCCNFKGNK